MNKTTYNKKLLAYIKDQYFDSYNQEWEDLLIEFETYALNIGVLQ